MAAPASKNKSFISRELHGASFLTLEHVAHMVLVVVIPGLILCAITSALSLWFGFGSTPVLDMVYYGGNWISTMGGSSIIAALLVLTPLLPILSARTRSEWHKRPAYAGRLAYKIPLYSALAATTAIVIGFKIQILAILLAMVTYMGATDGFYVTFGYASMLVPAFVGLGLFSIAWWYMFKLVKGVDYGRTFSTAMALIGIMLAIALFLTTFIGLHSNSSGNVYPVAPNLYSNPYQTYEDIRNIYQ